MENLEKKEIKSKGLVVRERRERDRKRKSEKEMMRERKMLR